MHKISKALFGLGASLVLFGISAPAATHANASSRTQNTVKVQQATQKPAKATSSQSTSTNGLNWRKYHSKVFIANRGYGIFKNDWNKVANSSSKFHRTYNVNGQAVDHKRVYDKLFSGKNYFGYINKNALVNTKKNIYLKQVPYVSQYRPVYAPWGCAEASLTMMIRSTGHHVSLPYIYRHTPMSYNSKGGQKGSVYTGAGFGHVITAAALTRYAHRWTKRIHNISGASANQIKMYVQSGHPVLFYGYSSYQLPGDTNRNHCKVITAYKNGNFRVYDPLYFHKSDGAFTQGRNPLFDRGAVSWYSMKRFNYEYAHIRGNNRKSALVAL